MNDFTVQKTKFPRIEKNPSLLGFGCMRLPVIEAGKPDIDEAIAEKMIDLAFEQGVNYFDTAYPYHQGMSELFIGKALKKYPREQFHLADKMPSWLIQSVDDAKRIFAEQLQKCQVEYFDYYLCHALNRDTFKNYQLPGVMDFLYEMKKDGKIRHLGFSFHDSPDILDIIMDSYEWDFVQLQINYLDWDFIDSKRIYNSAVKRNIPVIVMEPVRGGTLATLSEKSADILKTARPDKSVASWAIRYVASLPQVLTVLSGMSNLEQTLDNLGTVKHFEPLTQEDHQIVQKALKAFLDSKQIPCTACNYCMPCPHGVDIPLMFKLYNSYAINNNKHEYLYRLDKVEQEKWFDSCIDCEICESLCPQHIVISDQMEFLKDLHQKLIVK